MGCCKVVVLGFWCCGSVTVDGGRKWGLDSGCLRSKVAGMLGSSENVGRVQVLPTGSSRQRRRCFIEAWNPYRPLMRDRLESVGLDSRTGI